MSISALNWAFGMRGVSVSQKVVLISLANFSDENGYSFPSIKTIAEISCMSTASVRRALSDLCSDGILRVEHRFRADGSQTSSGYFLELTPPVNLTPPPLTMTSPPVTADTPYNHQITTTLIDTDVSIRSNKRGTRLKADWIPDQNQTNEAAGMGLTMQEIDNEAAKFRDYYIAKSGQSATKVDWSATWRNWCRNVIERRGKASKPNPVRDDGKPQTFLGETLRLIKEREGHGYGG